MSTIFKKEGKVCLENLFIADIFFKSSQSRGNYFKVHPEVGSKGERGHFHVKIKPGESTCAG